MPNLLDERNKKHWQHIRTTAYLNINGIVFNKCVFYYRKKPRTKHLLYSVLSSRKE